MCMPVGSQKAHKPVSKKVDFDVEVIIHAEEESKNA